MNNKIKIALASSLAVFIFSGCSMSNPLGVGYEKSSCEISGGFGVCGSPKDIYIYKDVIKGVQADYMKSGYEGELFFAVSPKGEILVKEEREDAAWENYKTSAIKADIDSRLAAKDGNVKKRVNTPQIDLNSSTKQDTPVTVGNDLSVIYQKQKFLLETTEVGGMIRDNGRVQKFWLAPVVDKQDSLVSARTMYVVLEEPKWKIGEKTPKTTKINILPTPISKEILKKQQRYDSNQEKIINSYNNNDLGGLQEAIERNPKKIDQEIANDMIEIQKFLAR